MNTHPYLRAYLAGIFVPTLVLPLILAGFITVRLVLALPIPIERFIIFPMAVVPSLFGLWNMLYLGRIRALTCPSALTAPSCLPRRAHRCLRCQLSRHVADRRARHHLVPGLPDSLRISRRCVSWPPSQAITWSGNTSWAS